MESWLLTLFLTSYICQSFAVSGEGIHANSEYWRSAYGWDHSLSCRTSFFATGLCAGGQKRDCVGKDSNRDAKTNLKCTSGSEEISFERQDMSKLSAVVIMERQFPASRGK